MTTNVSVNTATVSIRTVPLTGNLLKQIPHISYEVAWPLVKDKNNPCVIGWIHASCFSSGGSGPRLLLQPKPQELYLFCCLDSTAKKYPQIFLT